MVYQFPISAVSTNILLGRSYFGNSADVWQS